MPHLKIGGTLLIAMLLVTHHFYTAHFLKDQFPPDLILGIIIGWILGFGIITKMIRLK